MQPQVTLPEPRFVSTGAPWRRAGYSPSGMGLVLQPPRALGRLGDEHHPWCPALASYHSFTDLVLGWTPERAETYYQVD